MKRAKRFLLIVLIIGLIVTAGVFLGYPMYTYFHDGVNLYSTNTTPEISKESPTVDYDKETGALYVNDEIIVMAVVGTKKSEIEQLAKRVNAQIAASLDDIGFYRFRFDGVKTYDELQSMLIRLKQDAAVEDAYINSVFEVTPDAAATSGFADDAFEYRDPVYPNDPWNGDSWNTDAPRGANWGVEAIHAPIAWGYKDELNAVNLGLIDTIPNTNHEDLQISAFITITETTANSFSFNSDELSADDHGTHVAGTIGATWNDLGVTGVAGDKARVYYSAAYYSRDSVVQYEGYYDAFSYLTAIQTLVDRDVKAINISQNTSRLIGFAASRGNSNAVTHLQNNATMAGNGIKRIVDNGKEFVICVAAGNSNNTYYYKDDKQPYGYREEATIWESAKSFFGWRGEIGDSQAKYNNFLNLITDDTAMSRIIVVGSVGINSGKSNDKETRYTYSGFSNIGSRVDLVGPGENIYSSVVTGYADGSGTSMATPHITGVAGLIFAANPDLSGADVKRILLASTYGRFYYTEGYSGMADAGVAVVNALKTREHSVNSVIKSDVSGGLDVCFLVDTTSSMGDDIDDAKQNMTRILDELAVKSEDFRVALIDYRDFPERTSKSDYPAKVQLEFSEDPDVITQAINSLSLGDGGDNPETVYSGLMEAVGLDWRAKSTKVIIVLGDAPPLDPEPYTGYTLNSVMAALYNADVKIDLDASDKRVLGDSSDSLIKVYSIGTDANAAAEDFFRQMSEITGGAYTGVDSADEVSGAILESIEQIEITPLKTVKARFGDSYSDEVIEIFQDGKFFFEITLDENGAVELENMEFDRYDWKLPRLMVEGTVIISEDGETAEINYNKTPWYQFAINLWQRQRLETIAYGAGGVVLLVILLVVVIKIKKWIRNRKSDQSAQLTSNAIPVPSPGPPSVTVTGNGTDPGMAPSITDSETPNNSMCPNCGAVYHGSVQFCGKCGGKIS